MTFGDLLGLLGVPAWAGVVLTAGVPLAARYAIARYRKRPARLSWSLSSVPAAGSNLTGGLLTATAGERRVDHAFRFFIELRNDSSVDLSDLVIDIKVGSGSKFLAQNGAIEGSQRVLTLEEKFLALAATVPATEFASTPWINEMRVFSVPVLNRKAIARFDLLIEAPSAAEPELQLTCDHVGVIIHRRQGLEVSGVPIRVADALAVPVVAGLAIALAQTSLSPVWIAVISATIGFAGWRWGVLVYRFWRWFSTSG